jgi:hypothetical protein
MAGCVVASPNNAACKEQKNKEQVNLQLHAICADEGDFCSSPAYVSIAQLAKLYSHIRGHSGDMGSSD